MKNHLFVICLFSSSFLIAQKAPSTQIQNTLVQLYHDATDVDWEFEDGKWEAEFDIDHQEFEVRFDQDDQWLETAQELKCRDLPAQIKEKVRSDYPSYRLDDVERIWMSDFEGYRIELEKWRSEITLLVAMDGTIVSAETEVEEN